MPVSDIEILKTKLRNETLKVEALLEQARRLNLPPVSARLVNPEQPLEVYIWRSALD